MTLSKWLFRGNRFQKTVRKETYEVISEALGYQVVVRPINEHVVRFLDWYRRPCHQRYEDFQIWIK